MRVGLVLGRGVSKSRLAGDSVSLRSFTAGLKPGCRISADCKNEQRDDQGWRVSRTGRQRRPQAPRRRSRRLDLIEVNSSDRAETATPG